jgi:hypothetical protein
MSKHHSQPLPPVTVVCTNHLNAPQAQDAWNTLLRHVLLPNALRDATLPAIADRRLIHH